MRMTANGENFKMEVEEVEGSLCFEAKARGKSHQYDLANISTTDKLKGREEETANMLLSCFIYFSRIPFIPVRLSNNLENVAKLVSERSRDDFCWALSFEPSFIGELMTCGFLPMCDYLPEVELYFLLPKLHVKRCVLKLSDLHIGKQARKKAKNFTFTVDTCFELVCAKIIGQHGAGWFFPPLVNTFILMHRSNESGGSGVLHKSTLHSIEIWDSEGKLVAGEVGYAYGSCYTSLSGFSSASSAGTVQLSCIGAHLNLRGYTEWDLGMDIEYKKGLGARNIERDEFLERIDVCRKAKLESPLGPETVGVNARSVIDSWITSTSPPRN